MRALLFSLLLSAGLAHADFNAEQWHSRAPLKVSSGSAVSEFTVTPDVLRHSSAHLNDLRIIRDGGDEVPYTVRVLAGEIQLNEHAVVTLDKSWSKSKGVQAILDLQSHAEHNRLRISTSQRNFKEAVVLETSDDGKRWSTVLANGVIFDITRPEAMVSDLTVTYPTSTRRYVRITLPGWTDSAFLESAWLAERNETDSTRDTVAELTPTVSRQKEDQKTEVIFDLGFIGQPCDRLDLRVAPGYFSRSVEVSTSNDQKTWTARGGAVIDRTSKDERLTAEWPETWDRYIKLTIFDGDSAPLDFGAAKASAIRRVVRFPSNNGGTYWLYLDNAETRSPSYDFARTEEPTAPAARAVVGPIDANPTFRAPLPPYSERKPWVLNLLLGIAVAVMAFITYRFARKTTSTKV